MFCYYFHREGGTDSAHAMAQQTQPDVERGEHWENPAGRKRFMHPDHGIERLLNGEYSEAEMYVIRADRDDILRKAQICPQGVERPDLSSCEQKKSMLHYACSQGTQSLEKHKCWFTKVVYWKEAPGVTPSFCVKFTFYQAGYRLAKTQLFPDPYWTQHRLLNVMSPHIDDANEAVRQSKRFVFWIVNIHVRYRQPKLCSGHAFTGAACSSLVLPALWYAHEWSNVLDQVVNATPLILDNELDDFCEFEYEYMPTSLMLDSVEMGKACAAARDEKAVEAMFNV